MNVVLNEQRQITGVFAGDLVGAHKVGIEFVRRVALQPVAHLFDVVVTTNSGYPLDQNLYQGVKGLSAGTRILKPDRTIILADECRVGVPINSHLDKLLRESPRLPNYYLCWRHRDFVVRYSGSPKFLCSFNAGRTF